MKILNTTVIMAITVIVLTPALLLAEDGPGTGSNGYISVFYPQIKFRGENQLDTGDGAGLRIGGVAKNVVSADVSVFRTLHDAKTSQKTKFTGLTYNFKLLFPFPIVMPYVAFGIGRYVLEDESTVYRGNKDGSGINGYQVGGGIQLKLSQYFSMNVGYMKRRMEFDYPIPADQIIRRQARSYEMGMAIHFK